MLISFSHFTSATMVSLYMLIKLIWNWIRRTDRLTDMQTDRPQPRITVLFLSPPFFTPFAPHFSCQPRLKLFPSQGRGVLGPLISLSCPGTDPQGATRPIYQTWTQSYWARLDWTDTHTHSHTHNTSTHTENPPTHTHRHGLDRQGRAGVDWASWTLAFSTHSVFLCVCVWGRVDWDVCSVMILHWLARFICNSPE